LSRTTTIPSEVIFDRYFSGHSSPAFRAKYRGRLNTLDFTDAVLGEALGAVRDEINKIYELNAAGISSPDGCPIIHMDYLNSEEVNAFAFFEKGVSFIALTKGLLERLIQISSQLWRLNLLGDLLGFDLSTDTRNVLGATALPILIQILSSHELGHFFHGHCGESALAKFKAENNIDRSFDGLGCARELRCQAMEVEADGYAAHMMLQNFFNGGVGEFLFKRLQSRLPKEEFILSYFVAAVGSLFYLWGPRSFDPAQIRQYDHPPALMRMNVFMRDINGWCSEHRPGLVAWGSVQQFQGVMRCVAMADESGQNFEAWQRQGEFLLGDAGKQYIADLYSTREKLRSEMEPLRWHFVAASEQVGRSEISEEVP